ncbi:hypothetical protein [Streptomyces sp. XH2]|uniref:hypothetical protein n=1 Tax=Streptomyces sp. XH2 TaxID=3412483 RepID=UPI003C79FF3C
MAYAHGQLCHMHRVRARPPVAACWQDWGRPPYAAAWHLWRTGRATEEVAARMRAPAPGGSLHVVSDCRTPDPGSIPGALGCAEQVLREHLSLPRPPWSSTETLGFCGAEIIRRVVGFAHPTTSPPSPIPSTAPRPSGERSSWPEP